MSIHIKLNRTTAAVLDRKIVAAIDKYFAGAAKVTLAGEDYTPATLKAVFERSLASADALDATRAALRQQVVAARARGAAMADLRKALQRMLLGVHGESAVQVLEDFGMAVPKRAGPKTVQAKADAAAKAEATRAQRGSAKRRPATHVIPTADAPRALVEEERAQRVILRTPPRSRCARPRVHDPPFSAPARSL